MNIYLDYQATTPIAPEVMDVMLPWLSDDFANPHSVHAMGRKASAAIEMARVQIEALLPKGRLIFTSGATEALNQAIIGLLGQSDIRRSKIITLPSEHAAVLDVVRHIRQFGMIDNMGKHRHFEHINAPLRHDGLVDEEALKLLIDDKTALVAAMLVNNEIGVIQPIGAIAEMAHHHGAYILCDIVQGYGRLSIPQNIDAAALSAHKIYGPKAIGALWVKDGLDIAPILHGGGQEKGLRSGTLSPALCAGFGKAASLMQERYKSDNAHIIAIWKTLIPHLSDWHINGSTDNRYYGNLNIRMDGLDVARLMSDLRHIAFSAGSACASGSGRSSHVLDAIGLSEASAKNSIRIGIGRYSEKNDVISAINAIDKEAKLQMSGV